MRGKNSISVLSKGGCLLIIPSSSKVRICDSAFLKRWPGTTVKISARWIRSLHVQSVSGKSLSCSIWRRTKYGSWTFQCYPLLARSPLEFVLFDTSSWFCGIWRVSRDEEYKWGMRQKKCVLEYRMSCILSWMPPFPHSIFIYIVPITIL